MTTLIQGIHTKVCNNSIDNKFSALGRPNKIWAVSSIHGDVERLIQIHDAIFDQIKAGDRLVYLGNYTGYGLHSRETIDELLMFRRLILAQPGMKASDVVYLRGSQEELWQKLLQIQFEHNPVEALLTLMGNGLGNTMQSYGISPHEGIMAAREGTIALTRWTHKIRESIRANAGHDCFMTHSRRAAFTHDGENFPLLFVNAGIDATKPLNEQDKSFWSIDTGFENMTESYAPFNKVIRGFDPNHQGVHLNCVTATLDGGCGFGGSLVCATMSAEGEIYELLEA